MSLVAVSGDMTRLDCVEICFKDANLETSPAKKVSKRKVLTLKQGETI